MQQQWCTRVFIVTALTAYISRKQTPAKSINSTQSLSEHSQTQENCKNSEIPFICSQNICFTCLGIFPNRFPRLCMSRWACDAIIHSHSQVFIILCALTVKPPALLFCLVIQFYPTVYKARNINQRLHHPANTEKWKQLSQPIIQKAHSSDDAERLTVWSYFYHGMKRPFNWAWNVLFVLCVLKIFSVLS